MANPLSLNPIEGSDRPYFGTPEEQPARPRAPLAVGPTEPAAPSLIARGEEHPKEYYAEMPATEVARRAAGQFLPSMGRAITALPSALINYEQTGSALSTLGKGLAGAANLYREKDPEQLRAQQEAFGSLVEPYTSVAGFKKSLAEDPFEILSTAATPFGGGITKAGTLVGKVAPKTGRLIEGVGRVATDIMDPTQGALDIAKSGVAGVAERARGIRDISTGVPSYSYEKAFEAGKIPNEEIIGQIPSRVPGVAPMPVTGQMAKEAFGSFSGGTGDAIDFSTRARNAADAVRQESIRDWANTKGVLTNATKVDIPLQPAFDSINEMRARLPSRTYAMDATALDALDSVERSLMKRYLSPQGDPAKQLFGIDQFKQDLYEQAKQYPQGSAANKALMNVYNGVKTSIAQVAPDYLKLMDEWQAIDDDLQNIQKSLGTGGKTAANAEMKKFMSAQRTPQGISLIERLGQKDPLIPFMVAGDSIHSGVARGAAGTAEKFSVLPHMYNIGAQMVSMDPSKIGLALGLAGMQGAVQSPSLMGATSYGLGRIAGSTPYRYAMPAMDVATRVASPASVALARQQPGIIAPIVSAATPVQEERPYFPGEDRTGRATGGRIGRGMTSQMLIAAVERAKAEGQKTTKSILEQPDEHVVRALKVANENI